MSVVQIPNLASATSLGGSEQLEAVQAGSSVKITVAQIGTYVGTTYPAPGISSVTASSPLSSSTVSGVVNISLPTGNITNAYLSTMAAGTVKANLTGGSAAPSDVTPSAILDTFGTQTGSLLYRDTSSWQALTAGTNATILRSNGTTSAPSWSTLSTLIDAAVGGSSQGSILFRGATSWQNLFPGTAGQLLQTQGSGANPAWFTVSGAGTVASIATGTGLTGGPITVSGTISIATTGVSAGSYGSQSTVGTFTVNAQGQITAASNTTINAVTLTTGTITTTPSNSNDITNKAYVDAAVSNVNYHAACNYATTADLGAVTYNNGTSGVGATITKTTPFATLAIDGGSPTVNQRILVKNESNGAYNGIYTVTSVGSGSVGWVLTRATDYDQVGTGTNEIAPGDTTYIISGTQNAGTQWVQTTDLPITIGTTAIVFAQIAGPGAYTAGTGLTLTGTQFSIANTTVTANSYGSASSVGSFTVNAQGQLTAASSTPIAIAASQITSGTLPVAQGGTGIASYTIGDLIYASGTTTLSTLADVATGNALLSGGVGGAPSWGKVNLTSAISGTLPVANGGTGQSIALTQYGVIYGASTTAMGVTAAGATGQVLVGNTSAAPSWSTLSSLAVSSISFGSTGLTPSTATTGAVTVAGTLAVANGGTGITTTPANGALLIGNATGYTSTTLTAGTAISVTNGAGSITIANTGVTSFSAGSTGLTPSTATTGAVSLAGTLGVGYGGTGTATTFTTGSVVFAGASGVYSQNNSRLFWDNTNFRIGINTASPAVSLAISATDAILLPVGTTAQQPTGATGMLRFNSSTTSFEGYNGTAWGSIGGGATGGGTDQIFYLNGQTVNTSYSIPSGQNAGTFGPVTIAGGAVVTVPSGSTWSVV